MKNLTIEIKELHYFYEFEFKFIRNEEEIVAYFRLYKNPFMILFSHKLLNELISLSSTESLCIFGFKEFDNLTFNIEKQSFHIIDNGVEKAFDIVPQTIFIETTN